MLELEVEAEPARGGSAELLRVIREDTDNWSVVIRKAGVQIQ